VRRRLALVGAAALACAGAGAAQATPSGEPAPDTTTPPGTYRLPGLTARVEPAQIRVGTRSQVTFSATLTRGLDKGTLELTLPQPWLERSAQDGTARAVTPLDGRASSARVRVRRSGRVVKFGFTKGRRGDVGRYTVTDRTLQVATYRPRFALRIAGRTEATATATVVVLGLPVHMPEP
jgi:hypothetical protein